MQTGFFLPAKLDFSNPNVPSRGFQIIISGIQKNRGKEKRRVSGQKFNM